MAVYYYGNSSIYIFHFRLILAEVNNEANDSDSSLFYETVSDCATLAVSILDKHSRLQYFPQILL